MKIITAPHPTLRKTAQPILKLDKKVKRFLTDLKRTLADSSDPQGVGLAAPQVNKSWRIFATQLRDKNKKLSPLRIFINPVIIKHSRNKVFGHNPEKKDDVRLEGCLSIPDFYGPVPRWQWVELEYQVSDGEQLVLKQEKFEEFNARVLQHEYDHLEGILFTDYILEQNLPLYKYNDENKKIEEIEDKSLLAIF